MTPSFTVERRAGQAGRSTVVFVPTMFAGGWVWDGPVDRLNELGWPTARIVEPLLHVGRTISSIATVSAGILDAVGTGPIVICGVSYGGAVALDLAARHTPSVRAVAISGVPGPGAEFDTGLRIGSVPDLADLQERIFAAMFYDRATVSEASVRETVALLKRPLSMIGLARGTRALRGFGVAAALARMTCPGLFVWGAQDGLAPPAPWHALVGERLELIDKCGHLPGVEQVEQYLSRLVPFVAAIDEVPVPATS
jgi:pimeloyl-ACP methyl ester carboxylesterase